MFKKKLVLFIVFLMGFSLISLCFGCSGYKVEII